MQKEMDGNSTSYTHDTTPECVQSGRETQNA